MLPSMLKLREFAKWFIYLGFGANTLPLCQQNNLSRPVWSQSRNGKMNRMRNVLHFKIKFLLNLISSMSFWCRGKSQSKNLFGLADTSPFSSLISKWRRMSNTNTRLTCSKHFEIIIHAWKCFVTSFNTKWWVGAPFVETVFPHKIKVLSSIIYCAFLGDSFLCQLILRGKLAL